MTRVLFLSERVGDAGGPSGSGAHVAATLAGLRAHFEVAAVTAAFDAHAVTGSPRTLRLAVPPRVRGLRRDLLLAADDRSFAQRALAEARSFRPDVVYERSEYFATAGLRVSRELGIPLVLEVNGLLANDARALYRSLAEPVGARLEHRKHRRADLVVTVSPGLARLLVKERADPARTIVVPNTIDPARVLPDPRPVDPTSGVVGFVGHLMPWHVETLGLLIDVAPRLLDAAPDVRFSIVGGGPGLEDLKRRAALAGLESRFRFTGAIPQDRVPEEVRAFDVGVTRSVFSYAFPVKLVEMGAAGVPVVAARTPSLDEMLEPGVEYEPFERGNHDSFVTSIRRMLAEPDRRAQLGTALHRAVVERFTWDASGATLAEAIERVVARAPRRNRPDRVRS